MLKLPGILNEQESSVQYAEQVWSWGNMYLPKHGKWLSQHLAMCLKILVPCQKEPQATISESSHVQWSFIQQKAHLCLRPCSLDNTLNRPSSAWESFNVRQKLGLFVLGVVHHISNLPTVCIILMRVGGWV